MSDPSNIGRTVAALRRDYALMSLGEGDVDADPIVQFTRWFEQALAGEITEPNAMTVATATRDGIPSARMVLLKGFDERGFVFYTNYESQKGRELAENPVAALVFHWVELHRQVRVAGAVERVSAEESDAYFQSRPRGSRLGAWASHQSTVLTGREELEDAPRRPRLRSTARATSRCRPTGAAIGSSRRRWSSGRAARAASMIACATAASRTAPGGSNASRREWIAHGCLSPGGGRLPACFLQAGSLRIIDRVGLHSM